MSRKVLIGIIFLISVSLFLFFNDFRGEKPELNMRTSGASGVSENEILIGSVSALSGHAGYLGTSYLHGAMSFINGFNEEGGIFGRKIKIISYDDQYDPPKTVFFTQKLIQEDKVFALFNYVGTPTAAEVVPILEEAKIPLLGLFTGADIFREPFKKYIFNVRASYYQETELAISHFTDHLGFKKIAVFYQGDAYGMDGFEGARAALAKRGLEPAASGAYKRGTLDVENALETILNANPQAVVMVGTYSPSAKFVKLAKQKNPGLFFHSVSFVGPEMFVKELGGETENVFITQVVPPPDESSPYEAIKKYRENLEKYYPGEAPSFGGLEGFINAEILAEGIKKSGKSLTRDAFMKSLESLKDYSVGINVSAAFGVNDHQGLDRTYFTGAKDGKFFIVEM